MKINARQETILMGNQKILWDVITHRAECWKAWKEVRDALDNYMINDLAQIVDSFLDLDHYSDQPLHYLMHMYVSRLDEYSSFKSPPWKLKRKSATLPRGCCCNDVKRMRKPISENDQKWLAEQGVDHNHGFPYKSIDQYEFSMRIKRIFSCSRRIAMLASIVWFQ
jgi:hypothetical protein